MTKKALTIRLTEAEHKALERIRVAGGYRSFDAAVRGLIAKADGKTHHARQV